MSESKQKFRVFVGGYSHVLTIDFDEEGIHDNEEFFEWLGSCDWIDMDNGDIVQVKNILFIEKVSDENPQPTGND